VGSSSWEGIRLIIAKCTHPQAHLCERRMSYEHLPSRIVHCKGDPKSLRYYRTCQYRKEEEVTIECTSSKICGFCTTSELVEGKRVCSSKFDTCFSQGNIIAGIEPNRREDAE
jgi:hypothetical protein